MFDFLLDFNNYEERKVGRWESDDGDIIVSTARCSDGNKPFETAIKHPEYNDNKWVVVAAYGTKGAAVLGHKKWVELAKTDKLPDPMIDCCNSEISRFGADTFEDWKTVFPRKPIA